jgi:hypothetical protein
MEETDVCHPISSASVPQRQFANPAAAKLMDAVQRQELAMAALAGGQSITELAEEHAVSRKFVSLQIQKAEEALEEAFASSLVADEQVLFHLPVTKRWLRSFVLALLLCCHSSYRGVIEILRDLFGYRISLGTICNTVAQAASQAQRIDEQQTLTQVRIGAHDEIFQAGQPVLVGVDVHSTYCYLLSLEEHRDAVTWGVRLLELQVHGFAPEAIICDAGSGLQAGQDLAMSTTPRRGDVFHASQETVALVTFLENRAYQAIAACSKLERHQAGHEHRHGRRDQSVSKKLGPARLVEDAAVTLADEVATLERWLRLDILAVAGPPYADRCVLYDFVVDELRARKALREHRIGPVCTYLVNQREPLLAFVKQLDADLATLAEDFQVPEDVVRQLLQTETMSPTDTRRWPKEAALRKRLRGRFHELSLATAALASSTVRASSVVENFNSRLRSYFFLRRQLGPDYLYLLRFFLNHRRFMRSEHPERAGRSPTELLTGEKHPHWLNLLGFVGPVSEN